MENEEIRFRLFALQADDAGIAEAERHRFSRVTPLYVLIYTEHEIGVNCAEIGEDETGCLSGRDRDWLLSCNLRILEEDARRREREISERMSAQIERLEAELKREAEKG